ncbi:hypothetical protein [Stenotrophobium rhamnosiphilum]|uniref:Uncharacterized protein n=1 Tax=Stenotrophobium rhamnosiphilum TaxID=2029166 RepID=A0A2T5MDA4_9GAMM|nr:hypothetical protein [Stenotrophobium rhamnosiphilum]PTU30560.1 hypothetical protein CJD38_13715 [Stenotrophobium rhamnosiphilum]
MNNLEVISTERSALQAASFLVYSLILITLTYASSQMWMTLVCFILFSVAVIQACGLLAEALFGSEIIEGDFGLLLDESHD